MKKFVCSLLPTVLLFSGVAISQSSSKTESKSSSKKEVVIEETTNDNHEKTVIVVDNGKVTINGKPASEYKGKKKIVIADGGEIIVDGKSLAAPHPPAHRRITRVYGSGGNKAILGVVTEKTEKGVVIKEVRKETGAQKAGLVAGDIITKVGDKAIASPADLVEAVGKLSPGDEADITYLHDGSEKKVKATLGDNKWQANVDFDYDYDFNFDMEPPMAMVAPKAPRAPSAPRAFNWNNNNDLWIYRSDRPKFGMSIEDNADGDGVKITGVEAASNAGKAGLKVDDLITEVDGISIKGTDALRKVLADNKDKASLAIKVLRSGKTENITLKVPKVIKKAEL